jgi:hypothetical protein
MDLVAERGLPVGMPESEAAAPTEEPPTATPAPEVESEAPAVETPVAGEAAATPAPEVESEVPTTEPPAAEEEAAAATAAPEDTAEPATEEPPAAEPPIDLAQVSFTEHVLPIFQQHCAQCHGGETDGEVRTEEGLSLLTYDDIMFGSFNGPVIEPGNVEDSYLIEQVVTGRMPKEGDPLSPAEIEIITAWVEAGAPNN